MHMDELPTTPAGADFLSWTAATTNGHFWSLTLLMGLWGAMKQLGRLQAASTSVAVEMKVLVGQQLVDGELETEPECSRILKQVLIET